MTLCDGCDQEIPPGEEKVCWLAAPLGSCCVTVHGDAGYVCANAARERRGGGRWERVPLPSPLAQGRPLAEARPEDDARLRAGMEAYCAELPALLAATRADIAAERKAR